MAFIDKYEHLEEGRITYIDTVFDSTNILKTTYFLEKERLYVYYYRGGTFSYDNITKEQHDEMLSSESVGKYFTENIKKYPDKYPWSKGFTLSKGEIDEIKLLIEAKKIFNQKLED